MSSFLAQGFQSTTAGNTSSIISGENSSDGTPLSDPAMGVSNYVGTFISGSNYSVIQIAVRCDTIVVVNVRESFTPDGEGFISHSITTTQADADGSVPTALYFYISCPYVRVEVVNTQPNNTIFQLSTKLTSASPPETATTDSGQTYTSLNGIPHLNAYIGGQTLNINVNSSALAPVVVTDLAAEASVASIDGKITACNTGAVTISTALPSGTNVVGEVITKATPTGVATTAKSSAVSFAKDQDGKFVALPVTDYLSGTLSSYTYLNTTSSHRRAETNGIGSSEVVFGIDQDEDLKALPLSDYSSATLHSNIYVNTTSSYIKGDGNGMGSSEVVFGVNQDGTYNALPILDITSANPTTFNVPVVIATSHNTPNNNLNVLGSVIENYAGSQKTYNVLVTHTNATCSGTIDGEGGSQIGSSSVSFGRDGFGNLMPVPVVDFTNDATLPSVGVNVVVAKGAITETNSLATKNSVASIDGKITACNTGAVVVSSGAITETNSLATKNSVASIDGKITACNTGAVVVSSGAITETNSLATKNSVASIDGKITACNTGAVVVSSGAITETNSLATKNSVASIDGKITACNTGAVVVASGAITETNSGDIKASVASIDGKITACNTGAVVVASGAITETNSGTINTAVGSINTKITACNTGAVVVASGAITETNSGTINTAVGSINTKITACNTGAVVVASGAITETNSSASKDSLASIDVGLNKTSTFTNISSVGLKSAGSFSDTFDLGVGADRYENATFLGVCNTTSYATPNFIFQYSFNNTDFFADGVSPSFYVNGSASSFVFQRASVPSRYVRLLFTADTFLTTLQLVLSK